MLETDDIDPVVRIVSPRRGEEFGLNSERIIIQYEIIESKNYTIIVYLNDIAIGYKSYRSLIDEIINTGIYALRVQATDIPGNIGSNEVEFTVYSTSTTQKGITSSKAPTEGKTTPVMDFIMKKFLHF